MREKGGLAAAVGTRCCRSEAADCHPGHKEPGVYAGMEGMWQAGLQQSSQAVFRLHASHVSRGCAALHVSLVEALGLKSRMVMMPQEHTVGLAGC